MFQICEELSHFSARSVVVNSSTITSLLSLICVHYHTTQSHYNNNAYCQTAGNEVIFKPVYIISPEAAEVWGG